MSAPLIQDRFPAQRLRLVEWLKALAALGHEFGDAEVPHTAELLLGGLSEPFLFVVLGEIKTGKSRFLNALLGVPGLCEEDAEAHTAAVEKLDYGETDTSDWISQHLRQRTTPVPLLQHLSIVDTPGTNSMVPAHEEITRQFLPRADLCIFVLFAKRPPSGTEWRLLDLIQHEWRKKVLFVLQQKDLLADEPDKLDKVIGRVRADLAARGLPDAPIFCTSAKWEEVCPDDATRDSGFPALREHIRDTVTGPNVQRLKLQAALRSAERALDRLREGLGAQAAQTGSDQAVLARIRALLDESQRRSREEVATLVARIIEHYQTLSGKLLDEFDQGLQVGTLLSRSVQGLWSGDKGVQPWLQDVQRRFQDSVRGVVDEIAERRARDFVDNIRVLIDKLHAEVGQLSQAPAGRADLGWDRERDAVLEAVRKNLASLQQADSFHRLFAEDPGGLIPMAGAGGALAVVGTVIVAATNVALFDITGGALAAAGLAVAGGYLLLKRPRIRREFRESLQVSEGRFREQLHALLSANIQHIYDKINGSLKGLFEHMKGRESTLARQQQALAALDATRLELAEI